VGASGRTANAFEAASIEQFNEVRGHESRIDALVKEAGQTDSLSRAEEIQAEILALKLKVAQISGPFGQRRLAEARLKAVPQMRDKWRRQYEEDEAQRLVERELVEARIRQRADHIKLGKISKTSQATTGYVVAPASFQP
jgi:hypothetical protein